jgi:hypothetical protein
MIHPRVIPRCLAGVPFWTASSPSVGSPASGHRGSLAPGDRVEPRLTKRPLRVELFTKLVDHAPPASPADVLDQARRPVLDHYYPADRRHQVGVRKHGGASREECRICVERDRGRIIGADRLTSSRKLPQIAGNVPSLLAKGLWRERQVCRCRSPFAGFRRSSRAAARPRAGQ